MYVCACMCECVSACVHVCVCGEGGRTSAGVTSWEQMKCFKQKRVEGEDAERSNIILTRRLAPTSPLRHVTHYVGIDGR